MISVSNVFQFYLTAVDISCPHSNGNKTFLAIRQYSKRNISISSQLSTDYSLLFFKRKIDFVSLSTVTDESFNA